MGQKGTRLEGKVAIVTGAGARSSVAGTGQATSIIFAREGAKVLLADRVEENALKTLETIEKEGGEASVFVGDVTKNGDCQAMAEAAVVRYGALHVLFNNVGIPGGGTVVDTTEEVWDMVVETSLKSMMLTSKHAVPRMVEAGGGSIINVSSVDGLRSSWGRGIIPYVASKGGVISMTRAMAVDHGRDNIRTNCIAPGHIHASFGHNMSDENRDLRRRAGPLGTEGTAWDVAWAALFLASDESRWISGVVLPVDAGLLATTPLSMLRDLR